VHDRGGADDALATEIDAAFDLLTAVCQEITAPR
jgi:hypothetical protein